MSEQKTIEENIEKFISGDALEDALNFVDYLKMNNIMVVFSGHENVWHIRCEKDEHICVIVLFDDPFTPICFYDGVTKQSGHWTIFWGDYDKYEHYDVQVDDNFKEFCWASVHICENCPCNNKMNMRKTIFGKDFENLCHCSLVFTNPDAAALEHIKKLVKMRKLNIADEKCAQ